MDFATLRQLASRQHGLATRAQLLEIGYTRRQIDGSLASGLWVRAAPAVYDVAPAARDPLRALHAAVLSSGGRASHFSAAALKGLVDVHPTIPHLTVIDGSNPRALDAVVHRSSQLSKGEQTTIEGIACTSALRTLLDLAHVASCDTLDDAMSRALTSGGTTLRRLERFLGLQLAGRPGATALRVAFDAHRDRRAETASLLEVIVLRAVTAGRLPEPCLQYPVVADGRRYRLDFAWPHQRVFLEANGFAFHSSRAKVAADHDRGNRLAVAGWLPLHATWTTARCDPDLVVRQVRAAIVART